VNREHRDYLEVRANLRSKDLAGKPLPTARDRDIRNAAARRGVIVLALKSAARC